MFIEKLIEKLRRRVWHTATTVQIFDSEAVELIQKLESLSKLRELAESCYVDGKPYAMLAPESVLEIINGKK